MNKAIATYETLIASYTLARERMVARRRDAPEHVKIELDQRIEANARTVEALGRAIEISREQIKQLDRPKAHA